jgi:hypothetical protein
MTISGTAIESQQIALMRARKAHLELAKKFPAIFASLVLKDERTGKRVKQAPIHDKWHTLVSKHDRIVIWAHIESGKTQQLSISRVLWELGSDPNKRVAVVSNTAEQAKKIIRACAQYIEKDDDLKAVFPRLVPSPNKTHPWTATMLTVARDVISKDPSIQACGMHGNITGSRIDFLILDDVLDHENTLTPGPREDAWKWLRSTVMSRLTSKSRVVAIGNAWHPQDAMHKLVGESEFVGEKFPVISDKGDVSWPERWPNKRIDKARMDLGPFEFARQMLCMARDDSAARFRREWISKCLSRGNNYRLVDSIDELPDGFRIVHGVDLGVQKHKAADPSAFFTICLWPDNTRQVLNIECVKMSGPEIVARIDELSNRYGGLFVVENNAAQQYIVQFASKDTMANVRPFTTGRNKAHPEFGIESIAAEMARGQWLIPNKRGKLPPEVEAWISDMLFYDPTAHTGDRLMASWFAREGCRGLDRTHGGGVGVRILGV